MDVFPAVTSPSVLLSAEASAPLPASRTKDAPHLNVTVTGDSLLVMGLLSWLVWDRLIKSKVVTHLDGVFQPVEEERKLSNLLAQIGLITHASRVILAALHNGSITAGGYSLTKISTVNAYTAPGSSPMATPIRDLPIGRIMLELEMLLDPANAGRWLEVHDSDALPDACLDYLRSNDISAQFSRVVTVGSLPIGILACQYSAAERRRPPVGSEIHADLLEDLYDQIAAVMRRRIIHPGPARRIWMKLRGRGPTSPIA